MSYSNHILIFIYNKTNGYCACCRKKLALSNYARYGERAAWEVAHRRARARGGGDGINNLWAMCIPCNRGMGTVDADRWCGR